MRTAKVSAHPLCQFLGRQQAVRLHYRSLPMPPVGFQGLIEVSISKETKPKKGI
jgi:hypothetical protein